MTVDTQLTIDTLRSRVQETLDTFLDEQQGLLIEISADLMPFISALSDLIAGGKRLRPAFCLWGYRAAGGSDLDSALNAAASLELLQACALIHDDVMDASDTRRGRASTHRSFAGLHIESRWMGDARRFGDGAAILLGDLCLSWADELLYRSGFNSQVLDGAKPTYDRMRTELMAGQYLDLLEQARAGSSVASVMRVVRYKSGKYTVERPLQLGAALAGASAQVHAQLSDYGLPLGEAFQLRDDLLGVFGDPHTTGKPAGDDLREGKRTLLVAIAFEHADAAQAQRLQSGLGDPDLSDAAIDDLRTILIATGARGEVERAISERTEQALLALSNADLADDVSEALTFLAQAATERTN